MANRDFLLLPLEACLDQLKPGEEPNCVGCGRSLLDQDEVTGEEGWRCTACSDLLISEWQKEARVYALENCRITGKIEEYDEECEYRCTREQYESGNRESYSPNSFLAHCRHNRTNYDALIEEFPNFGDFYNKVYYWAIRERIHELLRAESETIDNLLSE